MDNTIKLTSKNLAVRGVAQQTAGAVPRPLATQPTASKQVVDIQRDDVVRLHRNAGNTAVGVVAVVERRHNRQPKHTSCFKRTPT